MQEGWEQEAEVGKSRLDGEGVWDIQLFIMYQEAFRQNIGIFALFCSTLDYC